MDASEELQRLDADLAAGRVDTTSYRRRRDELVARRREQEADARAAASATEITSAPGSAADPLPVAPVVADPLPAVPELPPDVPSPGEGRPRLTYPTEGALRSAGNPVAADLMPASPPGEGRPRPTYPTEGAPRSAGSGDDAPRTDAFPVPRAVPATRGGGDPFPPPFRWGPDPATPDADATQVVPDAGEPTQVVPPSTFQPPTFPAQAQSLAERTQVVPGHQAGRWPSAPVPAARTTPPWVDRPAEREPSSGIAGSDVFYGGRRDLASTLGTVAVVVVVILILVLSFTLG